MPTPHTDPLTGYRTPRSLTGDENHGDLSLDEAGRSAMLIVEKRRLTQLRKILEQTRQRFKQAYEDDRFNLPISDAEESLAEALSSLQDVDLLIDDAVARIPKLAMARALESAELARDAYADHQIELMLDGD